MKNLTSEQLEKRKKTNAKVLKFGCLPISVFSIIVMILSNFNEKNVDISKKINVNMDSLVTSVKNCKDFEIKEVYFDKKDSSFNIAITNKDNMIKNHEYSIEYFNKVYNLDSISNIEGVYLFEFIKGKSFENKGYKNPLVFESTKQAKIISKFDKEYFSTYSNTYKPLHDYLQGTLNDPSSLEFISTEKTGFTDGVFSIQGSFRAKNALGALVINNVTCYIDINGNIANVQVTQ